jgi:16S rRNA (cytidine1402-2'-O)-methyltransferase
MTQDQTDAVFRKTPLAPGLYFVATPIGSARDITLRALDILASADVIAAEDTRMTRKLMELHAVPLAGRPLVPYHDHNGAAQRPRLLALIAEGKSVAYASDAGTPLVADPGFVLGRAAIEAGAMVTTAPGPSSVLAALTLSGLPTDRFHFAGFIPNARNARKKFLNEIAQIPATVIVFETAKRAVAALEDMAEVLGPDRQVALCREMTKKFETTLRGSVAELLELCSASAPRGEIVIVIDRASKVEATPEMLVAALEEAMQTHSVKESATIIAEKFGSPRRTVYQIALSLKDRA